MSDRADERLIRPSLVAEMESVRLRDGKAPQPRGGDVGDAGVGLGDAQRRSTPQPEGDRCRGGDVDIASERDDSVTAQIVDRQPGGTSLGGGEQASVQRGDGTSSPGKHTLVASVRGDHALSLTRGADPARKLSTGTRGASRTRDSAHHYSGRFLPFLCAIEPLAHKKGRNQPLKFLPPRVRGRGQTPARSTSGRSTRRRA